MPFCLSFRHAANIRARNDSDEETGETQGEAEMSAIERDRDFLLCSDEPLDDWVRWLRTVKGICVRMRLCPGSYALCHVFCCV